MAGNRFTKKLQAIKSRMMMDDVPVDPARRKLFTLPPEQTSQSLPVPQTNQPSTSSNLTDKVLNEPMDRRGFLNKTAQTARNAAAQRMLPSLSPLAKLIQEAPEVIKQVEPPPPSIASTLQKQINNFIEDNFDFYNLEDQYDLYKRLTSSLNRNDRKAMSLAYSPLMSKVKKTIQSYDYPYFEPGSKKSSFILKHIGQSEHTPHSDLEDNEIEEQILYLNDINKQIIDKLNEQQAFSTWFNLKDEADDTEDFHDNELTKMLLDNKHTPDQVHEFLDTFSPGYDEELTDEIIQDYFKSKKSK